MWRTYPLVTLSGLAVAMPAGHWVNTWVAMPQLTEYSNVPNPPFVRLHPIIHASDQMFTYQLTSRSERDRFNFH